MCKCWATVSSWCCRSSRLLHFLRHTLYAVILAPLLRWSDQHSAMWVEVRGKGEGGPGAMGTLAANRHTEGGGK
jgi:hypothetical protein